MKQIILSILLVVAVFFVQGQEQNALVFALDGMYAHNSKMFGSGYKLTYQQNIWKSVGIEIGGSYSMAVNTENNGQVVNDVLILDMTNHHAAYHFGVNGFVDAIQTEKITIKLLVGPMLSYQSNLYDRNHYTIINTSVVNNHPEEIYEQEVNEGIFFGADMAVQIAYQMNVSWGLLLDARFKAIVEAESLSSIGIGLRYVW